MKESTRSESRNGKVDVVGFRLASPFGHGTKDIHLPGTVFPQDGYGFVQIVTKLLGNRRASLVPVYLLLIE